MVEQHSKPRRYEPGPNDPTLPPQLSDFKNKTTDEVLEELNRMPFFMTKLDETDGNEGTNVELEALKALAYEGEPHEVAGNFKNQGNDLYRVKRFKDAREIYTKGIAVKCNDDKINESLFANRAACELELKNYRRCINDCKNALQYNPRNVKCFYRMAKAFLAIEKFDEAKETVQFGLQVDAANKSLSTLLDAIAKREDELKKKQAEILHQKQEKEGKQIILENAIKLRHIGMITTTQPADLLKEGSIRLEDPLDYESQLILPALIMYPTTDEFDFIAEVGELTSVQEVIDLVMQRPPEWFEQEEHHDFIPKKLVCYMETQSGGLVKIGKKNSFNHVLSMEAPKVPLFDNALKIYLVPKTKSDDWISKWDKTVALGKRQ